MRIIFAGTPALAVPSLQAAARGREVAAVLTSPDQPAGRGRSPVPSPAKSAALAMGLRVLAPESLDAAFLEEARGLKADLLVVAAFGKIFRKAFLDLFPMGGVNLHPSLLPRHRGPSPVCAAILAGDAETGVTIQRIAPKFDTGDILAQEVHPLRGDETTGSLTDELAVKGAALLGRVLDDLAAGRVVRELRQREEEATYCRTLSKEDGVIRWEEPAEVIERKVRAFDPWPRAATLCAGQSLLVLKSHVYPGTLPPSAASGAPGEVLAEDRVHGMLVRTGSGILALERLQPQFKKPMDCRAFLNGRSGIVGTRLGE
jgi:methionyl-tRNA formyltransferase